MSHSAAFSPLVVPKRRWFQFSMRTFLVLLTVFGIWLGLHLRSVNRQKEAVAAIRGSVSYDFQRKDPWFGFDPTAKSWVPQWLLSRLGVDFFHDVDSFELSVQVPYRDVGQPSTLDVSSDRLRHLEAFPDLRALRLGWSQITDDGMKFIGQQKKLEVLQIHLASEITDRGISHLKNLSHLKYVLLSDSNITDESLATFGRLPRLEYLSLKSRHSFTDQGLAYLREMDRLRTLSLGYTEITDEGLVDLKGLVGLVKLDLYETRVTPKGLEHLTGLKNLKVITLRWNADDLARARQALPNCKIEW